MNLRIISTALIISVSFGCASPEGIYSPACIAYAGSTIRLSEGTFTWEKFTDQVIVDDDGRVSNPFPGYPLQGSYRIDGKTVYLQSDTGEAMENLYLHKRARRDYLLTSGQHDAVKETGDFDKCALTLGGMGDN